MIHRIPQEPRGHRASSLMSRRQPGALSRGLIAAFALTLGLGALSTACAGLTGSSEPQSQPLRAAQLTEADRPLGQLPKTVTPTGYGLVLEIIPERPRFSGRATINVQLNAATDYIWLHGSDLNVTEATVQTQEGTTLTAKYQQQTDGGLARLDLPKVLKPQPLTLVLTYDAPFRKSLDGLYKVVEKGESYAFTQFEATDARGAFPSFDEPAYRTPFHVTLRVLQHHEAIASTPVVQEVQLPDGMKEIRYAPTPALPTYLLAFAVGPLDIVTAQPLAPNAVRTRPLPFRGVTVKGKSAQLAYALQNTQALLDALETYVGIPFPFAKLDIIAVPDFAAGAMENVGAVTFREWLLLMDETSASVQQRRAFAYVMAHELAHMWFGNLATMPWWNDIWLNESFATWLMNRAVDEVHPDYKANLAEYEEVMDAMGYDSLASARQIRQAIETDDDITNAFDGITYEKGGGVLSMLESYVGREAFQKGLQHYLRKFSFGSPTAFDLFAALEESTGRSDLSDAFRSFTLQPGVPLVDVALNCSDENTASLRLRQRRYFPLGVDPSQAPQADGKWNIPMCVRYGADTNEPNQAQRDCFMLRAPEETVQLSSKGCPAWVMPNAGGAGYYRFSVASEQFKTLAKLAPQGFSQREQLALGDSIGAAFAAGSFSLQDTLQTLAPFAQSGERLVAQMPMSVLRFARNHLLKASQRPKLERFARRLYENALATLSMDPVAPRLSDEDRLYRRDVLRFLALDARHPRVRAWLGKWGRRYAGMKARLSRGGKARLLDGKLHPEIIDPSLASLALSVAAQDSDRGFTDRLVQLLQGSTNAATRRQLLYALSSLPAERFDTKARKDLMLGEDVFRKNEVERFLSSHMSHPDNTKVVWQWVSDNMEQLLARLPRDHRGDVPWLASEFCDSQAQATVQKVLTPHLNEMPGGPRNMRGSLEEISICNAKRQAHEADARAYFAPGNT